MNYIVVPSIPYICREMVRYMANHPLIIKGLVTHPITGAPIKVGYYRNEDGLITKTKTLVCSVFPYSSGQTSISSATSTAVSATYEPYELGDLGTDIATYNIVVKYDYTESAINIKETNPEILTVPTDAVTDPGQYFLLNNVSNERIQYNIHPPFEIIGQQLELTRLVFSDPEHQRSFPIKVKSMEVMNCSLPRARWETQTNVVFHTGWLLVRLTAYVSRGWRDKFQFPVKDIVVSVGQEPPDLGPGIIAENVLSNVTTRDL